MSESEPPPTWRNKLINKKTYTILYGVSGCAYSASFRYFNGIITSIEKRFKIPSQNTGSISIGNDVSQIFASFFLVYYGSKVNRPQWMSVALFGIGLYCLMSALPHFLYGAGEDALKLTKEYELDKKEDQQSIFLIEMGKRRDLCNFNGTLAPSCDTVEGDIVPQLILFAAQLIFGVSEAVYYVFGLTYLDDNTESTESPLMLSFSYFIKMIGPAVGFNLASICLSYYIAPTLTPTITSKDPRWIGCWWFGWLILAAIMVLCGILMRAFPKELPQKNNKPKNIELKDLDPFITKNLESYEEKLPDGIKNALTRLLKNKLLMLNNFATIFYFIGQTPYLMFGPKYLEIQFLQTPGEANFYTGTLNFIAPALGILVSGIVISKMKPSARNLAAWNVFVAIVATISLVFQYNLGCTENLNGSNSIYQPEGCNCDYVKYTPICASNNMTYISACHAGCTEKFDDKYMNCSSIDFASPGSCMKNCRNELILSLVVSTFAAFLTASGITSNFLVSLRCVAKEDKSLPVGIMFGLTGLLAFIPAPIMYGALIDKTCLFWGKTCGGKGNCWLYDAKQMRFMVNIVGSVFMFFGALLDVGVWKHCKNIRIFDKK